MTYVPDSSGPRRSSATLCFFIHVIYAMSCLYIRSLSVMLSRISFHVLIRQRGVTIIMAKESRIQKGARHFKRKYHYVRECIETGEIDIVKVHTDDNLADPFTKALTEIHEEFRTSSGPSDAGGNPPPVTIHTWLERFNKQKPHSFEKVTALVDAENWISHMEKIFGVVGCEDAFKTRLAMYKFEGNAIAWWKAYKQAKGGDTWLITRFLRLAGFLEAAAGTEEEHAKNFQWGLCRSTFNHLMCMSYTDVTHVSNAARNYEILHERDDDDAERPDKRQKSGDRHQPTSQQSSHRNHGHNNDVMGQTGEVVVTTITATTTTLATTTGIPVMDVTRQNRGQQSNRSANSGSQQSRGSSEGHSYPVCTACGRRHLGECRRAAGTCFKCGQAGHLQKDCKKNTTTSTSGQADKKPGTSGRVFAITEDHATKTSGTITGALHSTAVPKIKVSRPRHAKPIVTKTNSPTRRHINRNPSPKANNSPPRVPAVKAPMVNAAQGMQGK
nr:hypothetical protein [Tanacetum cinerariifolium]